MDYSNAYITCNNCNGNFQVLNKESGYDDASTRDKLIKHKKECSETNPNLDDENVSEYGDVLN